jgi:hypothetical protein
VPDLPKLRQFSGDEIGNAVSFGRNCVGHEEAYEGWLCGVRLGCRWVWGWKKACWPE